MFKTQVPTRWNANQCYLLWTTPLNFLTNSFSNSFIDFFQVVWERTKRKAFTTSHCNSGYFKTLNLLDVTRCKNVYIFCCVTWNKTKKNTNKLSRGCSTDWKSSLKMSPFWIIFLKMWKIQLYYFQVDNQLFLHLYMYIDIQLKL